MYLEIPKNQRSKFKLSKQAFHRLVKLYKSLGNARELCFQAFLYVAKETKMITVERASHTDLYDQVNVIPFEEMDRFIKENM